MWSYRDNFDYTKYYSNIVTVYVKYHNEKDNKTNEYTRTGILTKITKSDYGCVSVIFKDLHSICSTSVSSNLIDKVEIELNETYKNDLEHIFKNIPQAYDDIINETDEYLPLKKTIII